MIVLYHILITFCKFRQFQDSCSKSCTVSHTFIQVKRCTDDHQSKAGCSHIGCLTRTRYSLYSLKTALKEMLAASE